MPAFSCPGCNQLYEYAESDSGRPLSARSAALRATCRAMRRWSWSLLPVRRSGMPPAPAVPVRFPWPGVPCTAGYAARFASCTSWLARRQRRHLPPSRSVPLLLPLFRTALPTALLSVGCCSPVASAPSSMSSWLYSVAFSSAVFGREFIWLWGGALRPSSAAAKC